MITNPTVGMRVQVDTRRSCFHEHIGIIVNIVTCCHSIHVKLDRCDIALHFSKEELVEYSSLLSFSQEQSRHQHAMQYL